MGNKSKLRFWHDCWVKGNSVRELIQGPLQHVEDSISIEEMRQGGVWNWNAISFDLPQCVNEKILAMPFQLYGSKEDTMRMVNYP